MPGKTFALGITLGSTILKPISPYSASLVSPHQRQSQNTSIFLKGTLGGVRYCGKSSNNSNSPISNIQLKSGGGSGSGHNVTGSTASAAAVSSAIPSVGSISILNSGAAAVTTQEESVVNVFKESGDVVTSMFKAGSTEEYFDLSKSFTRSEKWKSKLVNTMLVYPNFISEEEEVSILKEIEPYISRLHYENSHWDDAIHEYRETERGKWNKKNEVVINRIRELAFPPGVPQLKLVHILDLAKKGLIKPHIDSIRFCGNTIAGLSLLSNCVMRLKHDVQTDFFCDVYIPRLSLYVMKDFTRYEFTHEILGQADSNFQNKIVERERRLSIICRNEPEVTTGPVFKPLM